MSWTPVDASPRAPSDRIAWFVDTYGPRGFAHAAELLPILHRDDPEEAHVSLHEDVRVDAGLRATFRERAEHVRAHPSPMQPESLAAELRALSQFLDDAPDQALRTWRVALPAGTTYVVFELVTEGAVACVATTDLRVVDAQQPGGS